MFQNSPYRSQRLLWSTALAATSLLVSLAPASAQDAATADAPQRAAEESPQQRRQTQPARSQSVRQFAPESSNAIIPAEAINLRAVLEQLGEDTIEWYQHVWTLSDPFFEGRAPGTRGHDIAVEYLEFWFDQYGLEPAFTHEIEQLGGALATTTSFQQEFEFAAPSPDIHVETARVMIGDRALNRGSDYQVLGNSGNGRVSAPITFVGYGISEGPNDYSSFDDDTDLSGRIAFLLRYEPLNDEGTSQWSQRRFSGQAAVRRKIASVLNHNPAAIVFVNPPGAVDGATGLESPLSSAGFGPTADVPIVQIETEVAAQIIRHADPEGRELEHWRKMADNAEVKCVALDSGLELMIETKVDRSDRETGNNVAGILRGSGELADEWIIIGGHFDHVGYGYFGSRAGAAGRDIVHPGADDNASGTASVLVLAKRLTERYADDDSPRRSILFMGFSAEESGLHGSRAFTENPSVPLEDTSLMINLDMVGRLRENKVSVSGTGTAEQFDALLPDLFASSDLEFETIASGTGPSDHSNFYRAGVPVLFFFTGLHNEYHRPEDKGHTVNPTGAIKIVDIVEHVAWEIAHAEEKLVYAEAAAGQGQNRGYASVRLGIRPGMGEDLDTGILIDEVSDGTSADNAGLQPGDVMLEWDGSELDTMRALFEALQNHKPGDVVQIKILRGDEEMTIPVTLQASDG